MAAPLSTSQTITCLSSPAGHGGAPAGGERRRARPRRRAARPPVRTAPVTRSRKRTDPSRPPSMSVRSSGLRLAWSAPAGHVADRAQRAGVPDRGRPAVDAGDDAPPSLVTQARHRREAADAAAARRGPAAARRRTAGRRCVAGRVRRGRRSASRPSGREAQAPREPSLSSAKPRRPGGRVRGVVQRRLRAGDREPRAVRAEPQALARAGRTADPARLASGRPADSRVAHVELPQPCRSCRARPACGRRG